MQRDWERTNAGSVGNAGNITDAESAFGTALSDQEPASFPEGASVNSLPLKSLAPRWVKKIGDDTSEKVIGIAFDCPACPIYSRRKSLCGLNYIS